MTDAEMRTLVREVVARRLGRDDDAGPPSQSFNAHPSHGLLALARGGDEDGACIIEPAVRCNHCGYCLSQGH